LKFRQNFAEIRRKISFSLVTGEKKIRYFSENFGFEIQKKSDKNSPKFRNGISLPPITGIRKKTKL